jgi:hypothetical protein
MNFDKIYPPLFHSVTSEHQAKVVREFKDRVMVVFESLDEARDDLKELERAINTMLYGAEILPESVGERMDYRF